MDVDVNLRLITNQYQYIHNPHLIHHPSAISSILH